MRPEPSSVPATAHTQSVNYGHWPGTTPIAKAVPPLDAAQLRRLLEKLRAYDPGRHTRCPAEVREIIRLVLDGSMLPDHQVEAEELRLRLRGYLIQLVASLNERSSDMPPPDEGRVIQRARVLLDEELNSGAHLVSLAWAAQDLLAFFPVQPRK
ncbi:DUF6415 family natural product biosynthesis protein [Streptomyces sp. MZ04]|uniref:DUF6415 family natural product biosynthesis protein n=1 Tax=Streptomyces sp. MZ04 TaxID=2559236 RepID=UPI00107E8A88|nr:DUF6415 family natural product biosynthesis protein [Streptomyces sp. MZ04]TGA97319.1 hypothetical protein E2651_31505 [Streptomyces sp. MZ04]